MIIATAGFTATGSSVVTEYLMEFEENSVYRYGEFLLPYYPDGLGDLDYHINSGAAKFLSSTVAIPRFRRVANYLLGIATKGKIEEITEKYLEQITQCKWIGYGQGQDVLHNLWLYRNFYCRLMGKIIKKMSVTNAKKFNVPPLTTMEYAVNPENFYSCTQNYTDSIFRSMGYNLKNNIVLDQGVPGNNPQRYLKYFKNAKAIVVDRDPRDVYVSCLKYYPQETYSVPFDNVKDFVVYHLHMRRQLEQLNDELKDVAVVSMEDMIYNYESTTEKLKKFLNLGTHTHQRVYFNPEESIRNTQIYKFHPELTDDISYIEDKMSKYLFDFDRYDYKPQKGGIFAYNPRVPKISKGLKRILGMNNEQ